MGLYPTAAFDEDSANGLYIVAPGSLLYRRLTLAADATIAFSLAHVANTQDFSMRAWISDKVDGNPIVTGFNAYWPVVRQGEAIVLHDLAAQPGIAALRSIPAMPGNYVLNVLNLVNSENVFTFSGSAIP